MTSPQNVDSKFRFILVAAKRARQLQAGAKPMVQTLSKKSTRVAQHEVEAGLIPFEIVDDEADGSGKTGKGKSAK
jgi:DNA-directed RNA polymerase subunit omega